MSAEAVTDAARRLLEVGDLRRVLIDELVAFLGAGFHPDTRARQYVDSTGARVFTDLQAGLIDAALLQAQTSKDFDVYAAAYDAMQNAGLLDPIADDPDPKPLGD